MTDTHSFTEANVPDQSGKCYIVTGANTGLGFEVSRVLAERGARVLLACRDEAKAQTAISRIRTITPRADLDFLPFDQGDLDSIRTAAKKAVAEPRIDALINNAGVMMTPLMRTRQGFELQMGVNHLGCFALTSLLLPKLAQTPGSRVVITSSLAHKNAKGIDWEDMGAEQGYDRFQRYAASKFANMLFLLELDRRLRAAGSSILATGCHPGMAGGTDLGRHANSGIFGFFLKLSKPLANTPATGAWPTLLASAGPVSPGGYYGPTGFQELKGPAGKASRSKLAKDTHLSRKLWDASIAMTGIDPALPPAPTAI